ncbi:UDP-glucose/GDP-mannose dehydrogenase family protein [Candidatus Microgenomates bacterium]|nr:UDP-glucose/GDP-mannose dehydrogenase family protein [Candidatus Microgenomates bacterium]
MANTKPNGSMISADWISPADIGIIGFGIVGQALAYGFSQPEVADKYHIKYYDKFKESSPLEDVVSDSEFIFICLPTPMRADESGIDLSIIEDTIAQITKMTNGTDKIIVIKSTIVPGTTANFEKRYPKSNFCFNPEFLTEANYLEDFINADRTVIGANNDLTSRRVIALFRQRFPHMKIFQTDTTTAEMVKYMANAFLSTKVIFANEMFDICQVLGIKYEEVKSMVAADRRIGGSHMDVTTSRGFGGKCFPKDMVALIGRAKDLGIQPKLLETVWNINKKIRKVHDWEEIPFAVGENQRKPKK